MKHVVMSQVRKKTASTALVRIILAVTTATLVGNIVLTIIAQMLHKICIPARTQIIVKIIFALIKIPAEILPNAWIKTVPIQMIALIQIVKIFIAQTKSAATPHCVLTNLVSIQLNAQVAQEIVSMNSVSTQGNATIRVRQCAQIKLV